MTLQINGETRTCAAADLAALVAELGLPAQTVLVEHNGEALRRDEWPGRVLGEGDRLEIIRIVAGG